MRQEHVHLVFGRGARAQDVGVVGHPDIVAATGRTAPIANQRLLKRVFRDRQFQTGMEALIRFTINRLLKEQGDTSSNGHEPLS